MSLHDPREISVVVGPASLFHDFSRSDYSADE